MVSIPLYGGQSKRDIIQLAYEECGQAGYEFELVPEEYDSALRRMDAMLAEWLSLGVDLGYNFPTNGTHGTPEEESGIPDAAVNAVATMLAKRIAPSIGKVLSSESNGAMAMAWTLLRSTYTKIPSMQLGRQTPRGGGNRGFVAGRAYFTNTLPADEVAQ